MKRYPPDWEHPFVCDCEKPDADPRRNWGMCAACKRKPLRLMRPAS